MLKNGPKQTDPLPSAKADIGNVIINTTMIYLNLFIIPCLINVAERSVSVDGGSKKRTYGNLKRPIKKK